MQNATDRPGHVAGVVRKLPAEARGRTRFDWLDSWHSFSFGEYYDRAHMAFHSLRVLNDDVIAPGMGFGMHPHRDAEIFTYVISGALEHRDSLGNYGKILPGNLQYMSAGDGVTHSEFNSSKKEPLHLLQIWLLPNQHGGEPLYAEKPLGEKAAPNTLTLLFGPETEDNVTAIRQDARIFFGKLEAGQALIQKESGRAWWIHQIAGELNVAGETLLPGDAVAIEGLETLEIKAVKDAEFLAFSLA